MSISCQEIVGTVVSKLIERRGKDVKALILVADDGREILLRQDKDSNFLIKDFTDHKVVVSGVLDGSFFTPWRITDQAK
jgi:hypothetical protein